MWKWRSAVQPLLCTFRSASGQGLSQLVKIRGYIMGPEFVLTQHVPAGMLRLKWLAGFTFKPVPKVLPLVHSSRKMTDL